MSPRKMSTVLRELREKAGLGPTEVARKAELSYVYYWQLETGARKSPSLDVLKRLAKALGVDVADLLNGK